MDTKDQQGCRQSIQRARTVLALVSVAAVALALGSGCSTGSGSTTASGPGGGDGKADNPDQAGGASEVLVTADDNGSTVQVVEGQDLVVELEGNPTTGYTWEVTSTTRAFGYPQEDFVQGDPEAIGAGGIQRFRWKTSGPISLVGSHHIVLEYSRSWETDVAPLDKFELTVEVIPEDGPIPTPTGDVVLEQEDNGATVQATEGQNVVVELPSIPSAGYEWVVTATDRTFGYPESEFIADSDAIGSGGTTRLTWTTSGPLSYVGTHDVKLEYRRSWETDLPPEDTFEFTVEVVASE